MVVEAYMIAYAAAIADRKGMIPGLNFADRRVST